MESSRVVLAGGAAQGAWRADGAAGGVKVEYKKAPDLAA